MCRNIFLLQLHSVVAEFRKAREPLQQHAFVTQSNSLSETTCGPAAFLDSILTVAMSAGTSAATGSQRKIANFLLKICKISTEFFYYTKAVSQVNFFRLFFEPFFEHFEFFIAYIFDSQNLQVAKGLFESQSDP